MTSFDPSAPEPRVTVPIGGAAIAAGLDAIDGVAALHDRAVPGTRIVVDHIVVGPSGVYVIGTQRHRGPVVRRDSRLFVDSTDRSDLLAAMKVPADAVAAALDEHHLPISRALCFVNGDWPLSTPAFVLKGVWIGWSNLLYRLVAQPGRLQASEIDGATRLLDARLPLAH